MTVWVLHHDFTPEEEKHIHERTHLPLPFEGLPDLSMVNNQMECQHLLRALHPEEAPESIALKTDRIWEQFSGIQLEDTIAVPLPATGKVALANITGPYTYQVGAGGGDVHLIPVTWYPKLEGLNSFGRNQQIFKRGGNRFYAVTDQAARIAIQGRLPHKYNRFSRWKWVWGIILMLGVVRLAARLMGH